MDDNLAQKAIAAALKGYWKDAVGLNTQILKENPKDIDSLNRLARAEAELGNIKKAKETAGKVLKIDPFNVIATKCLARWKGLKAKTAPAVSGPAEPVAFLEEPGKTKLVNLLHPGDSLVLAKLDAADELKLAPHAHRVNIVTIDDKYVGRLPDDLSARLRRLMKFGNEYKVLVKSVEGNDVKIFLREVSRAEPVKDIPSFPTEKIEYVAFTPPELVHKKEESPLGGEEEI